MCRSKDLPTKKENSVQQYKFIQLCQAREVSSFGGIEGQSNEYPLQS